MRVTLGGVRTHRTRADRDGTRVPTPARLPSEATAGGAEPAGWPCGLRASPGRSSRASPAWALDGQGHQAVIRGRGLGTAASAARSPPPPEKARRGQRAQQRRGVLAESTRRQKTETRMTWGRGAQAPRTPPRARHCHRRGPACPHRALARRADRRVLRASICVLTQQALAMRPLRSRAHTTSAEIQGGSPSDHPRGRGAPPGRGGAASQLALVGQNFRF